jgi:hypothetical protein
MPLIKTNYLPTLSDRRKFGAAPLLAAQKNDAASSIGKSGRADVSARDDP